MITLVVKEADGMVEGGGDGMSDSVQYRWQTRLISK